MLGVAIGPDAGGHLGGVRKLATYGLLFAFKPGSGR